jgi:hypothetical protein
MICDKYNLPCDDAKPICLKNCLLIPMTEEEFNKELMDMDCKYCDKSRLTREEMGR